MQKIVLLNPQGLKVIGDRTMPFGLLAISASICKGYNVEIIDQRFEPRWRRRLLAGLKKDPICVGVTSLTGKQIAAALEISKLVKKHSRSPVVWGGVHATFVPQQTLENPNVDIVVTGEGDLSFHELLKRLSSGKSIEGIPGVWYKNDGVIIEGLPPLPVEIEKVPATPYHLIRMDRYIENGLYGRALSVFTSRGCPYRCTFCYNTAFYKRRWNGLKADFVIEEVLNLVKGYSIDHLQIMDDNFFVDLKRSETIIQAVHKQMPHVTFNILGMHVRSCLRMGTDFINRMDEFGCRRFAMSVESGSEKILNSVIKKDFKLEELFQVNRMLAKTRIKPTYGFMCGLPGEREEDFKKTIEVMFRLKRDNPQADYGTIKPYVPYPGTELYAFYLKRGFSPPQSLEEWEKYTWYNFVAIDIPWISKRKRQWMSDLYYSSMLINPEFNYIRSRLFRFFARILQPEMERRIRSLNLGIFPFFARILSFINNKVLTWMG